MKFEPQVSSAAAVRLVRWVRRNTGHRGVARGATWWGLAETLGFRSTSAGRQHGPSSRLFGTERRGCFRREEFDVSLELVDVTRQLVLRRQRRHVAVGSAELCRPERRQVEV